MGNHMPWFIKTHHATEGWMGRQIIIVVKKNKQSVGHSEREIFLFWHKTNLNCTPKLWLFLTKRLVWSVLMFFGVVSIKPFIMIEDLSVWDRHAYQMYAGRSSKETPRQQKTRPSGRSGGGVGVKNCSSLGRTRQDAQINRVLSFVYCW